MPHDRPRAWLRDPFPALSHWAGAALSLGGLVVLLRRSVGRPWLDVAAFAVYGVTLVQLYVASALAHSVHCSPEAEDRLTRLDYAAIFLLIAGTYTPFCVVTLRGRWGWGLLAAIWSIAGVGIVMTFARSPSARVRVITYVAMAWICVFATGPLVRALPAPALLWLLAGGVIYTTGAAVYFSDRPHLWPGRFAAHDLWHCMVLAGSACHFVAVAVYVAR